MSAGLIVWGISSLYKDKLMYWDFIVPTWCSYFLIAFGATYPLLKKLAAPKTTTKICPQCEVPTSTDTHVEKCSKCNTELEPIDGFYERHPELKDE